MAINDHKKRKPYNYPVSLFGPRSLDSNDIINNTFHDPRNEYIQAPKDTFTSNNTKFSDESNTFASRSRVDRQIDLTGTASGYGEYYCPEGVPVETALFLLLGAFGLAFGALFRAITLITGGRRKRRSVGVEEGNSSLLSEEDSLPFVNLAADMLWSGRLKYLPLYKFLKYFRIRQINHGI